MLQVERVLERMNVFLRLMHEGLTTAGEEERRINTNEEFARVRRAVPQILERLQSAFPVWPEHLEGDGTGLAVGPEFAVELADRFARLSASPLPGVDVAWHPESTRGVLLGTARLGERVQPFSDLPQVDRGDPARPLHQPGGACRPRGDSRVRTCEQGAEGRHQNWRDRDERGAHVRPHGRGGRSARRTTRG